MTILLYSSTIFYILVVPVISFNFTVCQAWNSGLQQRYDGYGVDWIFMPDGNDQPQVAVLRHTENDERGIFDDSQVSYVLYTRYIQKFIKFKYLRKHVL